MSDLMNDEAVYTTAPATPGLLTIDLVFSLVQFSLTTYLYANLIFSFIYFFHVRFGKSCI